MTRVGIRRDHLSEDGYKELNKLGPLMKQTIQIEFYDQYVRITLEDWFAGFIC